MSITERINGSTGELVLRERFTFSDSSEFRKQLNTMLDRQITSLTITLSDLEFMDSSGLGMLMVALKECQQRHISLSLSHPKGTVKQLLEMTRCNERFNISE